MRAVSISVAVVLAILAGAAPAQAGTLRAFTHHRLNVRIATDPKGRVKEAVFDWHVPHCDSGRFRFDTSTAVSTTGPPLAHLRTDNPYTIKDGKVRSRVIAHTRGRRISIYRWSGSFSAIVTVKRNGRVIDRCRFHRVRWTATAPRARLDLAGDQNDYILQGKSYSYVSPAKRISVSGDKHRVSVSAGLWTLVIAARPHHTLKPGRYLHALREPFNGSHPGIDLSGDARGCNTIKGEFTIRRAKFDRRGVRLLSLSFVQHCEGRMDAAARGTLTYRR
jgi:hypothetical protein